MKKKIIILLVVFCLGIDNINAYNYSDWSIEYPNNVDDSLIESEVRYKWYKEEIIDIEYLKRTEFNDKSYDLNDYVFTDEITSYEEIKESEDIIVNIELEDKNFTEDDINYILISNFNIAGELYFSEIEITDKTTKEKLNYEILENTNNIDLNSLKDSFRDSYIKIEDDYFISLKLDKTYNVNDLDVQLYYKSNGNGAKSFINSFVYNKNIRLFYRKIDLSICNGCGQGLNYLKIYNSTLNHTIPIYKYKEKLYKTFNVKRIYEEDYYNELDGYIKDENNIKTFYRYITDSYVFVDSNGIIVKDDNYCSKNYCFIKSLNKNNDVNINNPKTNDNIDAYFIILICMFLIIVFTIIAIEIMKIVKKTRTNKKSSFVEIHKLN